MLKRIKPIIKKISLGFVATAITLALARNKLQLKTPELKQKNNIERTIKKTELRRVKRKKIFELIKETKTNELKRTMQRLKKYETNLNNQELEEIILKAWCVDVAKIHNIDPTIVLSVIEKESEFRHWVKGKKTKYSTKGTPTKKKKKQVRAIGIGQVMPYTAKPFLKKLVLTKHLLTGDFEKDLMNPFINIEITTLILQDNIAKIGINHGISAYFWGMTREKRYMRKNYTSKYSKSITGKRKKYKQILKQNNDYYYQKLINHLKKENY